MQRGEAPGAFASQCLRSRTGNDHPGHASRMAARLFRKRSRICSPRHCLPSSSVFPWSSSHQRWSLPKRRISLFAPATDERQIIEERLERQSLRAHADEVQTTRHRKTTSRLSLGRRGIYPIERKMYCRCFSRGKTATYISEKLYIAPGTTKTHIYNISKAGRSLEVGMSICSRTTNRATAPMTASGNWALPAYRRARPSRPARSLDEPAAPRLIRNGLICVKLRYADSRKNDRDPYPLHEIDSISSTNTETTSRREAPLTPTRSIFRPADGESPAQKGARDKACRRTR